MASWLAVCLGVTMATAAADADTPMAVPAATVFANGTDGYDAFRIPGIIPVKGTLLAFAEGRKYGCGDFSGQHDVVMRRSTDAGASWSELVVLLDPVKLFGSIQCPAASVRTEQRSCEFWDPTPVYDAHTGSVFVLTARSWNHSGMSNQDSRMQGRMDGWVIESADAGLTWSEPRNITSSLWSDKWHLGTPSNGHGIQTATGRLIVPVYVRLGSDSDMYSAIYFSDDHGTSWHFAPDSLVGNGTSESEVVALQHTPGRLMFNHRQSRAYGERAKSFSDDDGLSWHGFAQVPSLPDSGCKGGIAAWPSAKGLLFVNADSKTERVDITLRVSLDDGETWPHRQLISGPGGYSDVVLLQRAGEPELACVIFEYNTCTIKVACVEPATVVARSMSAKAP